MSVCYKSHVGMRLSVFSSVHPDREGFILLMTYQSSYTSAYRYSIVAQDADV